MLRSLAVLLWTACALMPAADQDVLTGGYGNDRANAALSETILTPKTVDKSTFGRLFSLWVDGQIYAQPLYQRNVAIQGAKHDVVFVATMHNSVYAFDANTPQLPLWTVNLGPSVPTVRYGAADGPFSDIAPEAGILGTPVIDPLTGTLYVVAATWENGAYFHRLHALDTATGAERAGSPVVIEASVAGTGDGSVNGVLSFASAQHLQRPGLLLTSEAVYVAFGSHADAPPYHGWIVAYSSRNVQQRVALFATTPNGAGGAIWQSGRGLAADANESIYAVTGNGDTDERGSHSDSVLRLKARDLSIIDWFAPFNVQTLNETDDDLGTCGAVLISGTPFLVTGGKQGMVYLMQRVALGGQSMDDRQVLQSLQVGSFGVFNMALWPRGDGAILYTHGADDATKAWRLRGSSFETKPVSQTPNGFAWPFQGMAISASSGQPHSGILWVLAPDGYRLPSTGHLFAYDAEDLSRQLWDSAADADDFPGGFSKFANPTIAGGKVYVPTMSNRLVVYGLRNVFAARTTITPAITAVVNAASRAAGAVAPGEMIAIQGENIGLNPRVEFNGQPAVITESTAASVTAVVPVEVSGAKEVVVRVTAAEQGAVFTMPLMSTAPGIFSADRTGFGQGAILNPDLSPNSADHPAAAGWVVAFYATGLGQTKADALKVTVNGKAAEVLYAGAAPGLSPAIMQVNVRLPEGVTGEVPLQVTAAENRSGSTVTVAIRPAF